MFLSNIQAIQTTTTKTTFPGVFDTPRLEGNEYHLFVIMLLFLSGVTVSFVGWEFILSPQTLVVFLTLRMEWTVTVFCCCCCLFICNCCLLLFVTIYRRNQSFRPPPLQPSPPLVLPQFPPAAAAEELQQRPTSHEHVRISGQRSRRVGCLWTPCYG